MSYNPRKRGRDDRYYRPSGPSNFNQYAFGFDDRGGDFNYQRGYLKRKKEEDFRKKQSHKFNSPSYSNYNKRFQNKEQEKEEEFDAISDVPDDSIATRLFSCEKDDVIIDIDNQDDDLILKNVSEFKVNDEEDKIKAAETRKMLQVPPLEIDKEGIKNTLKKFGHEDFRPGQLEAIERTVAGKSSLALLATGSGKSLIYQIPAYLYRSETEMGFQGLNQSSRKKVVIIRVGKVFVRNISEQKG